MEKSPIRMKDLAKAAGCSVMTVSLALRGSPRVSAAKRQQIRSLARRLGYRPHPLVSALIVRRRKPDQTGLDTLAVLTKFDTPVVGSGNLSVFHSDLWAGLNERSRDLGFHLEEFHVWGPAVPSGKDLTRRLGARGIRGVILFPSGEQERAYPALDWRRFSIVAAGFHARDVPVHRAASDHSRAMEIALAELEKRGYRRPGLAMSRELDPHIRYAMSGRFLVWQQQAPVSRRVPLLPDSTRAGFEKWMRRHRPDVVLSLTSVAFSWLLQMGISVPRETGFLHLASPVEPGVAGLDLHTRLLGRATIDVLARELYLNRQGIPDIPELVLVSGTWKEGTTIRAAPAVGSARAGRPVYN